MSPKLYNKDDHVCPYSSEMCPETTCKYSSSWDGVNDMECECMCSCDDEHTGECAMDI